MMTGGCVRHKIQSGIAPKLAETLRERTGLAPTDADVPDGDRGHLGGNDHPKNLKFLLDLPMI